ncbi:WecB/TagA/CpsF family glycosyltransferase [Microbulbifer pacificus]|uniref:WecB/TagA/CpsF family glycosyltransferase n=1 Tax=Microbulbifer pacificus TaxID=407164 RepID=A0AAU0N129_9GAMM|nr:WecB/TagA/CpsF family glycosyltransferase [Microbulbifer pacificus]WOX06729.1 WecB/TagA/CpsF family glycosyltransferase [Microbulbifer pacificus]
MHRIELLGVPMDVASMPDTVASIAERIRSGVFTQHVVVNVAKLIHMQRDAELSASVKSCDIINIDGMGVVWGARFLGHDIPERVAGIDLFYSLLHMSSEHEFPVYFLGAREQVVQDAVLKLKSRFPQLNVAGWHHGYFWDEEEAVVEKIRQSGARLLFVAITSPRKENFIHRWRDTLGVDFVMGVGGTFDVVAGKVQRAPLWVQRAGLEWMFRMLQEPGRMWRRYLFTNSAFAWLLLREKLRSRLSRRTPKRAQFQQVSRTSK